MIALVDGDLICYINAVSAENDEPRIAMVRCSSHIERILKSLNTTEYIIYLSGGHNFRYDLNPTYKANRTTPDPIHREVCKQFLIREWQAIETDGYEADDALGCRQDNSTVICSIDKDLKMIPGNHYSWPVSRKGKIIKEETFTTVDFLTGMKSFFRQMLTGDTADNVIGLAQIGPVKASYHINDLNSEDEMYEKVRGLYAQHERIHDFEMNLDSLWVWRDLGVTYTMRREMYE